MTKSEYKTMRLKQLQDFSPGWNTDAHEHNLIVQMECGEDISGDTKTTFCLSLTMLLACRYTKEEIRAHLQKEIPERKHNGYPQFVYRLFSKGRCKNIESYSTIDGIGLKWDRWKYFDENGNWQENRD